MSAAINSEKFSVDELDDACRFFEERGFVVLVGVLDDGAMEAIANGWKELVTRAATEVGLDENDFVQRFPQNRDLWLKSEAFANLLFDTRQGEVARSLLGVSGVRLFHDHAISKPLRRSSTIPWHQDNSYWPVDRAGLSLWTPVDDVGVDGGCLTVLDGSHRDEPLPPRDFLADDSEQFHDDPRVTHLPVERGETVVLHGLTWHYSEPNNGLTDRLAYLSLWIPATARYEPSHADWHPTSQFISVEPGERIRGEHFPLFGDVANDDEGEVVGFPEPRGDGGPSMFKAGAQIASQLAWMLGRPDGRLAETLQEVGATAIADAAVQAGVTPTSRRDELEQTLEELGLQAEVRKKHVARDVYLESVQRWWQLAGLRIEELRQDG